MVMLGHVVPFCADSWPTEALKKYQRFGRVLSVWKAERRLPIQPVNLLFRFPLPGVGINYFSVEFLSDRLFLKRRFAMWAGDVVLLLA